MGAFLCSPEHTQNYPSKKAGNSANRKSGPHCFTYAALQRPENSTQRETREKCHGIITAAIRLLSEPIQSDAWQHLATQVSKRIPLVDFRRLPAQAEFLALATGDYLLSVRAQQCCAKKENILAARMALREACYAMLDWIAGLDAALIAVDDVSTDQSVDKKNGHRGMNSAAGNFERPSTRQRQGVRQ